MGFVGEDGGFRVGFRLSDTLTSPAMLSKYIERFNQIQERLGLDSFHS